MADQVRICPHPTRYTLTVLATVEKKAVLQLVLWIQYGVERSSVVDPIWRSKEQCCGSNKA